MSHYREWVTGARRSRTSPSAWARRSLGPLVAVLVLVGGCNNTGTTQQPPDDGASTTTPDEPVDPNNPTGVTIAGDGDGDGGATGPLPGPKLPMGAACDADADCRQGEVCEGIGCEVGQGRCVAADRICTRDLATYCGCDGAEFQNSGSCPGRRFAYRGACDPKLAVGDPCSDGRQCASKLCAGEGLEGCGRGAAGTCADSDSPCTTDLVSYCGCNNFDFQTSGSCPNRIFAYRGPCEGAPQ